jgi:signal transduction histidine kinase
MTRLLQRAWPRSLTAQLILLLLLALVASQLATFAILRDERRGAVEALAREQVLERAAALVRLLETTANPGEQRRALRAFSSRQLRFWLAEEPMVDQEDPALGGMAARRLANRLESLLDDGRRLEIRVAPGELTGRRGFRPGWQEHWRRAAGDGLDLGEPPEAVPVEPMAASGLMLAIRLDERRWLNAAMLVPPERPDVGPIPLVALLAAALAISLVAAFSLRRLTRPLGALAAAADAVGRGEPVAVEASRGPVEIRRTARAFNAMQERIGRSLDDRTRLLGAISHDLRTPITTLRLRVELIEDEALKERMLETLDEMQALTEAGLLLARDTATEEPTRAVDLVALVESVVADFADQGRDAAMATTDAQPLKLRCRKLALTRAIRNLVENALRYGGSARLTVGQEAGIASVTVEDDGPGLPEAMLERVFEPFFRLEASRSPETGGSGLGLAIARSIIRAHGGDVTLANRPGGGLRAWVQLPLTQRPGPGDRDI